MSSPSTPPPCSPLRKATRALLRAAGTLGLFLPLLAADAVAQSPGLDALDQFRQGRGRVDAVQNRFFMKSDRFEVAPVFGYVPNNPFAKRYVGGVQVAYHFTETLAAEGVISYSPDLGESDLKGLTRTLIEIAHTGGEGNFQQPLDKITLSAAFGARWSPLYGKINLVGETVLNFDLYGTAGLGMLSKSNYYGQRGDGPGQVTLVHHGNEVKLAPTVGVGFNFFLNQAMALKLDARMALYVDSVPDYGEGAAATTRDSRLYNNFVVSSGISFFFPRMQPRLYNF